MFTNKLQGKTIRGAMMVLLSLLIIVPTIVFNFAPRSMAAAYDGLPLEGAKLSSSSTGTSFLLSKNGDLYAWGSNYNGQIGLGDRDTNYDGNGGRNYLPQNLSESCGIKFTEIFGGNATFAIAQDGELYAWGDNNNGGLGLGDDYDLDRNFAPSKVSDYSPQLKNVRFKEIICSTNTVLALEEGGELWSWGSNGKGLLGIGDKGLFDGGLVYKDASPKKISDVNPAIAGIKFKDIAFRDSLALAVSKDGEIFAWGIGYGNYGQLGAGTYTPEQKSSPINISADNPELACEVFESVAAGGEYAFAMTTDGKLFGFGKKYNGNLGTGSSDGNIFNPIEISLPPGVQFDKLLAGYTPMALSTNGLVYTWGSNSHGVLGNGTNQADPANYRPTLVSFADPSIRFLDISSDASYHIALSTDGRIYSWGYNNAGELGLGDSDPNYDGNNGRNYSPQFVGTIESANVISIQSYNGNENNTAGLGGTVPCSISGFKVNFDTQMNTNAALLNGNEIVLKAEGSDVNALAPSGLATSSITSSWSADGKTLIVKLPRTLAGDTNYTLSISGYRKAGGFNDAIITKTQSFKTSLGTGNGSGSGSGSGGSGNENGNGIDGSGQIDGNSSNNSNNVNNSTGGSANGIRNDSKNGASNGKSTDKDLAGIKDPLAENDSSGLASIPVIGPVLAFMAEHPVLATFIGGGIAIIALSFLGLPAIGLILAAGIALACGMLSGNPIYGVVSAASLLGIAAGAWWFFIIGKKRNRREEAAI